MQPAFHLKDDANLTLSRHMPKIPKKFRPPDGGIKENPAAIASYIFARYEKISKNAVCFSGASPRFRFFRLIRFAGLPRKSRGATSSTHAKSKPRGAHASWTHPRSCHCPRYRQQPERANQSV